MGICDSRVHHVYYCCFLLLTRFCTSSVRCLFGPLFFVHSCPVLSCPAADTGTDEQTSHMSRLLHALGALHGNLRWDREGIHRSIVGALAAYHGAYVANFAQHDGCDIVRSHCSLGSPMVGLHRQTDLFHLSVCVSVVDYMGLAQDRSCGYYP